MSFVDAQLGDMSWSQALCGPYLNQRRARRNDDAHGLLRTALGSLRPAGRLRGWSSSEAGKREDAQQANTSKLAVMWWAQVRAELENVSQPKRSAALTS